jgi:hypothetical protein
MRKLLLGFGLMAVSRYLGQPRPGLLGFLAPRAMLGAMLAGAATELLGRRRAPARQKA